MQIKVLRLDVANDEIQRQREDLLLFELNYAFQLFCVWKKVNASLMKLFFFGNGKNGKVRIFKGNYHLPLLPTIIT